MWVSVSYYKRKPGISWEQFSAHWRDIHGPLVAGNPNVARHIKRYVQHHLKPNESVPGVIDLPYDGFSEVWFESMEDRRRMFQEPDFQNLVIPDEANFIDLASARASMSDTQVVQRGNPITF